MKFEYVDIIRNVIKTVLENTKLNNHLFHDAGKCVRKFFYLM